MYAPTSSGTKNRPCPDEEIVTKGLNASRLRDLTATA
jgi:hypothetical protein